MFVRSISTQNALVSLVGALLFATVAIGAAVPVLPIA